MLFALLVACGGSSDPRDDGSGASFARVVNESGAALVLVGDDVWDDDGGWDSDCDDGITIDIDGDALVVSGTARDDCSVRVRTRDVDEIVCDGDGRLDDDGELRDIARISLNGNGAVHLHHLFTDILDLAGNGNGSVQIDDLQANALLLDLSGSSEVVLGGAVAKATMHITGNGNLDARALIIRDLTIDMTGSGSAVVTVEHAIDGNITGNGSLDVYGNPLDSVDVSGSGSLTFHD